MILQKFKLDFQWPHFEPFLFCVHHNDLYPAGNTEQGIDKNILASRNLGQDFELKDGFRMYHGKIIPGFPVHPHRGFETITIVRKGYIDHADSMGAAGRYGQGDVQWMTAGSGVQHSEMFPLLQSTEKNPVELFQIWLNLPKKNKMADPHFTMFWNEKIPIFKSEQDGCEVSVISGFYKNVMSLNPPPDSWASDPKNEVKILLVKLPKNKIFELEKSVNTVQRAIYFFNGSKIKMNRTEIDSKTGILVDAQIDLEITAVDDFCEILVLQSATMNEPVVQHGPFVMNSKEEISKTIQDYQKTQFGGWAWPRTDMTHGSKIERFAKYPDGRIEKPSSV